MAEPSERHQLTGGVSEAGRRLFLNTVFSKARGPDCPEPPRKDPGKVLDPKDRRLRDNFYLNKQFKKGVQSNNRKNFYYQIEKKSLSQEQFSRVQKLSQSSGIPYEQLFDTRLQYTDKTPDQPGHSR